MTTNMPDSSTRFWLEQAEDVALEDGVTFEESVRYCWVDENGKRVSPVHKEFGYALSWISNWHDRWERFKIMDQQFDAEVRNYPLEEETDTGRQTNIIRYRERERERITKVGEKVTLTGLPPHDLKRLVIRTVVETPAEYELEVIRQMSARKEEQEQ